MFKSKYDIFSVLSVIKLPLDFVLNSPINSNDIFVGVQAGLHNFNKWKLHKYVNILILIAELLKII